MTDEETVDIGQVTAEDHPAASIVIYAPDGAQVVTLSEGVRHVVGRTDDADVVIAAPSLSRTHARIGVVGGTVVVEDLGSKNGTKVNGTPVVRSGVRPGDELSFGSVPAILLMPERASRWVEPKSNQPIIKAPAMIALFETVDRFADAKMPVLIEGETGSGKEVVAQSLHDRSGRKGPMACINCGAIPEQLVENTLFGHERGAFTGADSEQAGVFESAEGGTVFLDEIGELPLAAQAALLRALETRHITRVGSTKEIAVDIRVVAATNRNLEEMCEQNRFRWDLLYRLNAVTMKVPPLRSRQSEIPLLVERFLRQVDASAAAREIEEEALALLSRYRWPGNVRELANVIQRASVMAAGRKIEAGDLPERIQRPADETEDVSPRSAAAVAALDIDHQLDFKTQLAEAERQIIIRALEGAEWNQTEAAARLDMPLRTLVHKIKKLGMKDLISEKRAQAKRG